MNNPALEIVYSIMCAVATTLPASIGSKESLFLGRCKACRGTVRIHAPVTRQWTAHLGYGRTEKRFERVLPSGLKREGWDRFFAPCLCGRQVEFRMVRGRVDEKIPCGAKCMGATGPACSCSCGGKNHGGSWS